jgi:hypothetical protein
VTQVVRANPCRQSDIDDERLCADRFVIGGTVSKDDIRESLNCVSQPLQLGRPRLQGGVQNPV